MRSWIGFASTLTLILSLATFYVVRLWITRVPWAAQHRIWVWLGAVVFVGFQIIGPYLYRANPNAENQQFIIQWISYITLGCFACLFFYTLVGDLIARVWGLLVRESRFDFQRRALFTTAAVTGISAAMGMREALGGPKIYERAVPIKDLPIELDGLRIAQISDLHVGPTIRRAYCERVARLVAETKPDLIAVTGDMVDGEVEGLRSQLEPLKTLQAKYGVFYVTGNHEFYWGVEAWKKEFASYGWKVLENEHSVLKIGKSEVLIGGVPDQTIERFGLGESSPAKSIEGAPKASLKILLAHQPKSFEAASKAGYDLQLSGHTHAGQFFPWTIAVYLAHRYYKDLNRHENLWVYVNRGTGYWGPPLRFLIPSEVTLLKLQRWNDSVEGPA